MGDEREPYAATLDGGLADLARRIDTVIEEQRAVIDWRENLNAQREMRRDIKRLVRDTGRYGEDGLDEIARRIIEAARRRLPVSERGEVRFGDALVRYEVVRSPRRHKTIEVTVDA